MRNFALVITAIICSSLLLCGCASLPIESGAAYWRDLYRRIPYKTDGDYRVMDIFYATDRAQKQSTGDYVAFTKNLSKNTNYGQLHVRVSPYIKIGKMIPNRLKRKGKIGIQNVNKLDKDDFINRLHDAIEASPHHSVLVMVFGYKDDFEATAIKAAYFSYLLDVNTPVLLFDWPGDQGLSIGGYLKAEKMAEASGPYLGRLLTDIIRKTKPKNLWLKASSLGSEVVCYAFSYMYQHDDLKDQDQEISHVILAAPDVSRDEFINHFEEKLTKLAKKLTAYVSSDDDALLISGIINDDQRLGRIDGRIDSGDHKQLNEAKELLYLQSLKPEQVTIIDVTPINQASFKHGYYIESPEFYDDFYARIMDKKPNVSRRMYLLESMDNADYWILRGDN